MPKYLIIESQHIHIARYVEGRDLVEALYLFNEGEGEPHPTRDRQILETKVISHDEVADAVRFPHVAVHLPGENGNVFAIMGRVTEAMKRGGVPQADREAYNGAIFSCCSYDEALRTTMQWVTVQ